MAKENVATSWLKGAIGSGRSEVGLQASPGCSMERKESDAHLGVSRTMSLHASVRGSGGMLNEGAAIPGLTQENSLLIRRMRV